MKLPALSSGLFTKAGFAGMILSFLAAAYATLVHLGAPTHPSLVIFKGIDWGTTLMACAVVFAASGYAIIKHGKIRPVKISPNYPPPQHWAPPPPAQTTLADILSRALINGLSADLNVTLKLPPGIKMPLLGQEWDVGGATITIGKAPAPQKTETPLAAPVNEAEKRYFEGSD